MTAPRVAARLSPVLLAVLAAGLSFAPVLEGSRLPLVVAVSAVVPSLLIPVLPRCPWWTVLAALTMSWVLVAAVVLPWPNPFAPLDVIRGVPGSVGQLLDLGSVVPAPSAALLVPSLLTFVAATTGVRLALRDGSGLLPVLPAWCAWATGVTLAAPSADTNLATAGVLVAATLLAVRPSRPPRPASVLPGLVVVAVLGTAGVAAAVASDGHQAVEIRSSTRQVADDVLARYDGWRARPAVALFDTDGDAVGRWRLADLDTIVGDRWITSASFRPAEAAQPLAARRSVTVSGLDGAFLPAVGALTAVRGPAGIWADPATGMLVRTALAGPISYELTDARPSDAVVAQHTEMPTTCRRPAEQLAAAVAGPDGPDMSSAEATAMALRLAGTLAVGRASTADRPYGCAALLDIVRIRRATEAQRVVAYVLAARARQVPARVVVGFTGRHTMTGADAQLWAEVHVTDRGWYAVRIPATIGTKVAAPPPESGADAGGTHDAPPPEPTANAFPRRVLLALAVMVAVLVAAGAVSLLVLRMQRRYLAAVVRRTGSPGDRLRAAWRDVVTRLSATGAAVPATATVGEVVEVARRRLDAGAAEQVALLAADADRLFYRDDEPAEAEAGVAWERRDRIVKALRAGSVRYKAEGHGEGGS